MRDTVVSLQWIIPLLHPEWHVCDYSSTKNKGIALLRSGEKNKQTKKERKKTSVKWVILHSALNKWMRTCLAHIKKQAYRPQQRVLAGLLWSGRHCFVTVKVQLLGGKQMQGTLPFSVIRSGSSNGGELGLFLFFSTWIWPFHLSAEKGSFRWTLFDNILDLIM